MRLLGFMILWVAGLIGYLAAGFVFWLFSAWAALAILTYLDLLPFSL